MTTNFASLITIIIIFLAWAWLFFWLIYKTCFGHLPRNESVSVA